MKLVEQSVEYLRQEEGLEGVYKQIERAQGSAINPRTG